MTGFFIIKNRQEVYFNVFCADFLEQPFIKFNNCNKIIQL